MSLNKVSEVSDSCFIIVTIVFVNGGVFVAPGMHRRTPGFCYLTTCGVCFLIRMWSSVGQGAWIAHVSEARAALSLFQSS